MFSFSLTSRDLLVSFFISSMTHWSLSNVLFSFQLFACFLLLFLLLSSSFNALWSDRMHGIISIFLYLLRLPLCPMIDQYWRMFHELLRRMYIAQKLDEIFFRHQLGPFDLWCDFVLEFLCWCFSWMTYLLAMGGIKLSHYHCVGIYIIEYVWGNWVYWCCEHTGW
jgi:hypothetical protein